VSTRNTLTVGSTEHTTQTGPDHLNMVEPRGRSRTRQELAFEELGWELAESAKGVLALGGYETQILAMRFPRNPVLSVGFRYRYFLAMRFLTDSTRLQRTVAPRAQAPRRCVTPAMVASLARPSARYVPSARSARRQPRHHAQLARQAVAASCNQLKLRSPWFLSWRLCLL
jgi:hypothetical protein